MGRNKKDPYQFYKGLPPKKTFGDKLAAAFKKAMLVATAGAAVGTYGYHHYGTQEELSVTVLSVEQGNGDDAALIHTDKGTFTNEGSWLHLKGEGSTKDIADTLRSGARATVRVYGLHPTLFGFSPDNIGLHRNVLSAQAGGTPAPTAAPVQTPRQPASPQAAPAPVVLAAPPQAGLRTQTGVVADGNLARPQTCADIAALDDMRATNPQIYRDLAILERLPQTGKAMFTQVTNPDAFLRSCLTPYDENSGVSGQYSNKRLRVMRGMGSHTTLHELFHARQDLNDSENLGAKMTMRDAAVANALTEATAVAYSLMAEREAKNLGLTLAASTDTRRSGADDNEGTRNVFEQAYQRTFAELATLDAGIREAKALEAGGRAVVRTLMLGDDDQWLRHYSRLVVLNLNNNQHIYSRNTGNEAGYTQTRQRMFESQGAISATINIIPLEFTGVDAERHITRCYQLMGIRTTPANAANHYRLRPGA